MPNVVLGSRRSTVGRWPRVATALMCCALFAGAVLLLLDRFFPLDLPDQGALYSQVVVDRNGRPLRAFANEQGVWRYQIELDRVSPHYLEALLTFEDRRFWWHLGVDPLALVRAAGSWLRHGYPVSGGSTISMQVARLLHPHTKTLKGKAYQMLRTLQLEWHLSKAEILTLYCNIAPFGGVIEGVQAASFTYLNKPASELTRAEAALLAVLPQSPTRFRPDLHPERARQARDKVLDRLVEFGVWSAAEAAYAKVEPVYARAHRIDTHAGLLAERLRRKHQSAVVSTTIERSLQVSVEAVLGRYVAGLAAPATAAALVVDNRTGDVLAYVGTGDFANLERAGHIDMVPVLRSPGSTLKPFLYGLAIDQGLIHAQSLLTDAPITWGDYRPGNFSGGFLGPVSATEALQRSLNVPAVDLLARYGPVRFSDRLANAGLTLVTPDGKPSPALILGGAGASLESLVQSYTAFANGGLVRPLRFTPEAPVHPGRYLLSEGAAWVVYDMLRGIGRPSSVKRLNTMRQRDGIAWKTGTSYGMRDAWAIGFDADYTLGVWVGRPDGSYGVDNTGASAAGPLFYALVDHLMAKPRALERPSSVSLGSVCWPLGTRAESQAPEHCQKRLDAWLVDELAPATPLERNAPVATNPLTVWVSEGHQYPPECRPDTANPLALALWPAAVEPWLAPRQTRAGQLPPLSPGCAPGLMDQRPLEIVDLVDRAIFRAPGNRSGPVVLRLKTAGGTGHRHWYANGRYLFSHAAGASRNLTLNETGPLQLVVVDDAGSLAKREIVIR